MSQQNQSGSGNDDTQRAEIPGQRRDDGRPTGHPLPGPRR